MPAPSRKQLFAAASALLLAWSAPHAAEEAGNTGNDGWRTPVFTGANPEKRDHYEALGRAADRVLSDRSFPEKWKAEGALATPEQAERALAEAEKKLDEIERAVRDKSAACYYMFLVNHCIGEARKLSFARQREVRDVMTDARTIQHREQTKAKEERRAARLAEPKPEPLDIAPKEVKPASSEPPVSIRPKEVKPAPLPGDYSPKQVKEPSMPSGPKPAKVREPSVSSGLKAAEPKAPSLPSGAALPGTDPEAGSEALPTREAMEEANMAALAEKEAAARERRLKAEKDAQERKAKREEKNRKFKEDQAKRKAAQLKYEEEQRLGKKSGLFDFF